MKERLTAKQAKAALRDWFETAAPTWELRREHLQVLEAVMNNQLAGNEALMRERFRQENRPNQTELDWLEGRSFLKQEQAAASTTYRLQFLGFAVLLSVGNSKADGLRILMDKVLKEVKEILDDPKLTRVTSLSLDDLALRIGRSAPEPELLVAMAILSTGSTGVNLNATSQGEANVTFSDHVYHVNNMLAYALHFVRGFGVHSSASVLPAPETPLSMTKLALVPDAHANAKAALARVLEEPSSAIGSAKSALESVLKMIAAGAVQESPSLPQLVKACQPVLGLDGEFVDLGRTITTLVQRIAEIRNIYSDGHGKAPGQRGATQAEARLVVGTSLLLCDYLLERWEAGAMAKRQ